MHSFMHSFIKHLLQVCCCRVPATVEGAGFPWQVHRQRVRDDLKAKKLQGMEYVKKFCSWHSLFGCDSNFKHISTQAQGLKLSVSIELNQSHPGRHPMNLVAPKQKHACAHSQQPGQQLLFPQVFCCPHTRGGLNCPHQAPALSFQICALACFVHTGWSYSAGPGHVHESQACPPRRWMFVLQAGYACEYGQCVLQGDWGMEDFLHQRSVSHHQPA